MQAGEQVNELSNQQASESLPQNAQFREVDGEQRHFGLSFANIDAVGFGKGES